VDDVTHEDPQAIITRLWENHRDVVAARLEALEAGIEAWEGGSSPSDDVVVAAYRAAHNLAGALGTYGRGEGSVAARELMDALRVPGTSPSDLRALLDRVKRSCS
jgi:outer membrane protein TolC